MVKSNVNALGIIFPNSYDNMVPELVTERLMASIPFAGRYRMIDFVLSSMVSSGIDNISIIVRNNYHSLMDHLGSGREWDLTRKNGGLTIIPSLLRDQKEEYVVMSDANIAVNFDFSAMLQAHIESGADVTVAYKEEELADSLKNLDIMKEDFFYTLALEGDRVKKIYVNSEESGPQKLSMNIYILKRELLIDLVHTAFVRGYVYFERDILAQRLDKLNVKAYRFDGYLARITDMKSYFDENMKLLEDENLDALFAPNPIYTKIRDDNPTRYINGSKVKNVMAADGCIIEGEVENCVLFRGVKIAKGAKVRNCVLMQDTVVGEGCDLEYVITDKNVTISVDKEIKGTNTFPVYAAKYQKI